jgi:hypothetical protein
VAGGGWRVAGGGWRVAGGTSIASTQPGRNGPAVIGSLAHVIRDVAVDVIINGSDTTTKPAISGVRLDHTPE